MVKKAARKAPGKKEGERIHRFNQEFCVAFGAQVRKLRVKNGVSMRQFAAKLNMEYNHVYLIEKGKVNTSITMVQAIAQELDVPISELFNFKFPPSGKKG